MDEMTLNFDLRGLQVIDACYDVTTSVSKNIKYTFHVLIPLGGGHIRSSAFRSNTDSSYET